MSTPPILEKVELDYSVKKDTKHFLRCFDAVRKLKMYWNKWITAKCWIDIINKWYEMPPNLKFTADNLNRAVGRDAKFKNGINAIKDANLHGVYKASFKEQIGSKRRMLTAYYITSIKSLPQKPGGTAKWYNQIVSSAPQVMNTRQAPVKRLVPVGPVLTNVSAPI